MEELHNYYSIGNDVAVCYYYPQHTRTKYVRIDYNQTHKPVEKTKTYI